MVVPNLIDDIRAEKRRTKSLNAVRLAQFIGNCRDNGWLAVLKKLALVVELMRHV